MISTCISYPDVLLLCIQATYQISALLSVTGSVSSFPMNELSTSSYQGDKVKSYGAYELPPPNGLCQVSQKEHFLRMLSSSSNFIDNSYLAGQVALYRWPEVLSCSPAFLGWKPFLLGPYWHSITMALLPGNRKNAHYLYKQPLK